MGFHWWRKIKNLKVFWNIKQNHIINHRKQEEGHFESAAVTGGMLVGATQEIIRGWQHSEWKVCSPLGVILVLGKKGQVSKSQTLQWFCHYIIAIWQGMVKMECASLGNYNTQTYMTKTKISPQIEVWLIMD